MIGLTESPDLRCGGPHSDESRVMDGESEYERARQR